MMVRFPMDFGGRLDSCSRESDGYLRCYLGWVLDEDGLKTVVLEY